MRREPGPAGATLGALARPEEREQETAAQAETARERIAEPTAPLDGFDKAAEEVRITHQRLPEPPAPRPPVTRPLAPAEGRTGVNSLTP
ncbi:hypothetical protein ACIGXM_15350 [Kitasatospora sp. NPDC052896]|uniref:hypothetical protein n=1 Tax=Kitasatospora sp. NPDC052896 TaxID=3364061 RepID=UPI0037C700F3